MKLIALASLAIALAYPISAAHAQAADTKPATAKKAPAKASTTKKASTQNKTAAKKTTSSQKKRVPAKTAKAVEANTPVTPITAHLSAAQLGVADLIHTGKIQCELGADV